MKKTTWELMKQTQTFKVYYNPTLNKYRVEYRAIDGEDWNYDAVFFSPYQEDLHVGTKTK